jgi:16S rRNA (cytosine967-C5)-methyltransferase
VTSSARIAAFEILLKVEAGGYASDLLLTRTAALDSRDAGLASEIVFGVLRYRAQLDFLIEQYSGRRQKLDREVRAALRMGIYQLRRLERVPAHAAVGESVELVKRARKASAMGFVNAVLRKASGVGLPACPRAEGGGLWPTREIELSCPEWLLARWERQYGAEAAAGIGRAALLEPENYTRGERIQDIGAQSIVPLLRLEPGHTFLDLCAAPGNKTAQALETRIDAIASDLHFHRAAHLKSLGVPVVVLDGTRPLPFARRFDRILVDAPCSGTGTLARNPEIKWRLTPEDLTDLARRQTALLANARAALAPGGLLVYSTCSLEAEENEEIAATVPRELIVETFHRLPGRDRGDGFFATLIQSEA